jgi:hypothetical protein
MENSTCFVIIDFGKKISYASGNPRILDLDKTYPLVTEPVFINLGINCYRGTYKT